MTKLILDTSVFVNPASGQSFANGPTAALHRFLDLATETKGLEFYMPPSVYAELMHFAEEKKIPAERLTLLRQQPPRKHEVRIPGYFLYILVESIRDRFDRGLRLAERHVREAMAAPSAAPASPAEKPIRADAEAIGRLRESYRRIMREGMLDSRADVDLLLLAYEIGGTLVSADAGVLTWAENLGVALLPFDQLPAFLERHRQDASV